LTAAGDIQQDVFDDLTDKDFGHVFPSPGRGVVGPMVATLQLEYRLKSNVHHLAYAGEDDESHKRPNLTV
jgi:hypothetical protein